MSDEYRNQDEQRREGEPVDERRSRIARRRILQAGAVGAAGAALGVGSGSGITHIAEPAPAAAERGRRRRRPNFLFMMVDEMRGPVVYESRALLGWRQEFLRTQSALMATGVSLTKHSIASTACVPSRASVFTGQYPSLHGCTQTDGGGKGAVENDMFWLQPNTVPTMGNYFKGAGYRCV